MGAIAVAIALGLEVGGVHFWGLSSLCLGVWILLMWVAQVGLCGVRALGLSGRVGIGLEYCSSCVFSGGCRVLWPGILVASGSIPVHAQVLMFVFVLRTLFMGSKLPPFGSGCRYLGSWPDVVGVWHWVGFCASGVPDGLVCYFSLPECGRVAFWVGAALLRPVWCMAPYGT